MYQKYHEVKGSLDDLKTQIEQSHGPLPDDLLEERSPSVMSMNVISTQQNVTASAAPNAKDHRRNSGGDSDSDLFSSAGSSAFV